MLDIMHFIKTISALIICSLLVSCGERYRDEVDIGSKYFIKLSIDLHIEKPGVIEQSLFGIKENSNDYFAEIACQQIVNGSTATVFKSISLTEGINVYYVKVDNGGTISISAYGKGRKNHNDIGCKVLLKEKSIDSIIENGCEISYKVSLQ